MSTRAIDASIRVHIDVSILNKSDDFRAVAEHRESAAAEAEAVKGFKSYACLSYFKDITTSRSSSQCVMTWV